MTSTPPAQTTFEDLKVFPTGEIPIIDRFMQAQGISRSRWLLGTQWKPDDIDDADKMGTASLNELDILYRNVFRLSTYPDTGLRFGSALNLSRWGILGSAMVSAKDLRQALLTQRRFLPLIHSRFEMDYLVTDEDVIITATHAHTWPLPISQIQSLEILAASLATHLSDLLYTTFRFKKIEFPYPEPTYKSSYYTYCTKEVAFDRPVMKLWIPLDTFSLPLRLSNPVAFKQAVDICEEALNKILNHQSNDTSLIVKLKLSECGKHYPKLEEMAQQLNTSARTLKRHLQQSGLTYRRLVNSAQLEKAQRLLLSTQDSITNITTQCGFKDSTGFREAFKRHFHMTPSQYRKSMTIRKEKDI